MVDDEAVESTTSCSKFFSQDEIMRIIDDLVNYPNAHNDIEIKLKPHVPHIKFVDVNDANKFLVVIFVDMATKKEERLLKQEKRLDSNSLDNIVDKKIKKFMHIYFLFLA